MAVKRRWDPPRSGGAPDRSQQEEGHHSTATEKPTVSNGRFHPHAIDLKRYNLWYDTVTTVGAEVEEKKNPTKTKTRDAQEVLSRTCDSEGVLARPAPGHERRAIAPRKASARGASRLYTRQTSARRARLATQTW